MRFSPMCWTIGLPLTLFCLVVAFLHLWWASGSLRDAWADLRF